MYWPTGAASRLSLSTAAAPDDAFSLPVPSPTVARLRGPAPHRTAPDGRVGSSAYGRDGEVLGMARNRTGTFFATITSEEIAVWSTRPKMVLTKVKRTVMSLRALGTNQTVEWRPDGSILVILTSSSNILLFALTPLPPSTTVYSVPPHLGHAFTAGPGEGLEPPAVVLRSAGELHVERGEAIACLATTPTHLVISISRPIPAVRSVPWPQSTYFVDSSKSRLGDVAPPSSDAHPAIALSTIDWIIDPSAHIISISHSRPLGVYVFITSDGRAYSTRRRLGVALDPNGEYDAPGRYNGTEHVDCDEEEVCTDTTSEDYWEGVCFYPPPPDEDLGEVAVQSMTRSEQAVGSTGSIVILASPEPSHVQGDAGEREPVTEPKSVPPVTNPATGVSSLNAKFNLVVIGLEDGTLSVHVLGHPSRPPRLSHTLHLRKSLNTTASGLDTGSVKGCAWTSDGHALAVSWDRGFSIWSVFGRLQAWAVGDQASGSEADVRGKGWEDAFMSAGRSLFWGPGNLELFLLTPPPLEPKKRISDEQLFALPFAKSAVTSLHSPDNTKNAFLQLDDRVLVYRGADSPDMSVINPESDVWQHIKIPAEYISLNWPIRYACISDDARLIAVAGKRGLTHYNALSGRWKLFENEQQEQSFSICGGMQWYGNVLIAATDEGDSFALRLFSRDQPLSMASCLHHQILPSPIILTSIFDNSLLVYTADNTLYHFLILPVKGGARLRMGGSIGFEGVVGNPARVRGMSWLIPRSQQRFGDPADDLNVATVIFLIDGKLVLLRPRRAADEEVKYDMQILADHIEFYWTHLSGIGTLENSLWGWDGQRIRVWLDALTIEGSYIGDEIDMYDAVEENLAIDLDFYPLSVLMDKGIIIGVNHEASLRRTLDFAVFRIMTNTHLFIHHVIRFHLSRNQLHEAVLFASHYSSLVYFAHALEILLHAVLEDEADEADSRPVTPRSATAQSDVTGTNGYSTSEPTGVLPLVVEFLDHFPEALQVVVGCARKTEVRRWAFLFDVVGPPRVLFEKSLDRNLLKIAASYLLVLHNLDPLEQSSKDTIRLFKVAIEARDWPLCKELLRFLYSLDHSGLILRTALQEASALPPGYELPDESLALAYQPASALEDTIQADPLFTDLARLEAPSHPPPKAAPEDEDEVVSSADIHREPLSRTPSAPPSQSGAAPRTGLGFGSLLAKVGMAPLAQPSFDFASRYQPQVKLRSASGASQRSEDSDP